MSKPIILFDMSGSGVEKLDDSRFYQRIKSIDDTGRLVTTIDRIWDQVKSLTTQVQPQFHSYTLHDMTHLGNVIGIMEELIPEEAWEQEWKNPDDPLGPLQCTLCLVAALVHDTGMAPPQALLDQLSEAEDPERRARADDSNDFVAYRRHWASHDDHIRDILNLRADGAPADDPKIVSRTQSIRTDYLRLTHADDTISGNSRIRFWLEDFQNGDDFYVWNGIPWLDIVERIAISHAHPQALAALDITGWEPVDDLGDEVISPQHAAWLLRLADILDLDDSRAPAVLFRHFRPDDPTSREHWTQHLCIGKRVIERNTENPSIQFKKGAKDCPNPQIRDSLETYMRWIQEEIDKVSASQETLQISKTQFPIRIPDRKRIELDSKIQVPGGWNAEAVRFELSQQDVVKILMGEELYGDPSLCLREVIQNALDATHLRWMRYQLRQKMEPGDYERHKLPPADASLVKEDLRVHVSWGEDVLPDDGWGRPEEKRHWIEIEDPGTGMSHETVQRYFTQIGRSYYQSAEYRRERALMRDHDLPVSEISQFGIGILSCFMLADLVEVHTCTVNETERNHYRIWGAEGIFWHQKGGAQHSPGTRIRMWLKQHRKVESEACEDLSSILHDFHFAAKSWENVQNYQADERVIDPLRAIWSTVAWPRYPITFANHPDWDLDDTAVMKKLLSFDQETVGSQYTALTGSKPSTPIQLAWRWWDWEHPQTASRIRIAIPVKDDLANDGKGCESAASLFSPWEDDSGAVEQLPTRLVSAMGETSLPQTGRTACLIRGIRVSDLKQVTEALELGHGPGCHCVIDLSGHAAPRLRADRKAATDSQRSDWQREVRQLFADWRTSVASSLSGEQAIRGVLGCIEQSEEGWNLDRFTTVKGRVEPCTIAWSPDQIGLRSSSLTKVLLQDLSVSANLARSLDLALDLDLDRDLARSLARSLDLDLDRDLARSLDLDLDRDLARSLDLALARRPAELRSLSIRWRSLSQKKLLAEVFGPDLCRALPSANLPLAHGRGSDARMSAPACLEFKLSETTLAKPIPSTIPFENGWTNDVPEFLDHLELDLISPFSQIPLGNLREACPNWCVERGLHPIFLLPFICSSALKWEGFRRVLSTMEEKGLVNLTAMDSLLLLIPDEEIEEIPFAEWTKEKMEDHVSTAYWKLNEDRVIWANGFHDRESILKHGKTLEELTGIDKAKD